MIVAAETLFIAMAYTQTIRPIVEGYQAEIWERPHIRGKKIKVEVN